MYLHPSRNNLFFSVTWCCQSVLQTVNSSNSFRSSSSITKTTPLKQLSPEQQSLRQEFWELENRWRKEAEAAILSEHEKHINRLHDDAVVAGHFTYDDPATGKRVFTRLRHFLRKSCCGSACRHVELFQCIYQQEAVTKEKRGIMSFNGSFWVPVQMKTCEEDDDD